VTKLKVASLSSTLARDHVDLAVTAVAKVEMLGTLLAQPEVLYMLVVTELVAELINTSSHIAERLRTRGAVVHHKRLDGLPSGMVLLTSAASTRKITPRFASRRPWTRSRATPIPAGSPLEKDAILALKHSGQFVARTASQPLIDLVFHGEHGAAVAPARAAYWKAECLPALDRAHASSEVRRNLFP
jgi:hypothetical protein